MPYNKTPITKILELLKLKFDDGLSQRTIANELSIALATVSGILKLFQQSQLEWPLPVSMTDEQLEYRLYPNRIGNEVKVLPNFVNIHLQLQIPSMTLKKAWQAYREQHQDRGYGFTQFREYYNRWLSEQKPSIREISKDSGKLFVNYVNLGQPIINPETGEIREAILYVANLGASHYIYTEIIENNDIEAAVMANVNALNYFGGSPKEMVTYQQVLFGKNKISFKENYQNLAKHYAIEHDLVKLRARKKANHVVTPLKIITRWLLMIFRSTEFHTLASLQNESYRLSKRLNQKQLKPLSECRSSLFKLLDAPSLVDLPNMAYMFVDHRTAKSRINHHVLYKEHFYSVPEYYLGYNLVIRASSSLVSIYSNHGYCIAQHPRKHKKGGYTTIADHMPVDKGFYKWSPQSFLNVAQGVGIATRRVIRAVLNSRPHPEHSYLTCFGIFSLKKKYSSELLELACKNISYQDRINREVVERLIKVELQLKNTS